MTMVKPSQRSAFIILSVGLIILAGGFLIYIFAILNNREPQAIRAGYLQTGADPLVSRTTTLPAPTKPSIAASNPRLGPTDAKVVIVEYSDFSCPYCKTMAASLKTALAKHPNVALVWKDFPNTGLHPEAAGAHVAARCAMLQGKFWPFHDWLFNNSDHSRQGLVKASNDLNMNLAALDSCLANENMQLTVAADIIEGEALNIDATPYIFIGDQRISGLLTDEELEQTLTLHETLAAERQQ